MLILSHSHTATGNKHSVINNMLMGYMTFCMLVVHEI